MGREIIVEEELEGRRYGSARGHHLDRNSIKAISNILSELNGLRANELRMLFETLFSRMSVGSKEAMVEILWSQLSPGEQQSFELPYFGSRWSDESISHAFSNAFAEPIPLPYSSTTRDRTRSRSTGGPTTAATNTRRNRVFSDHTVSHTFSGSFTPASAMISTSAHAADSPTSRGTSTRIVHPTPPRSVAATALANAIEEDLTSHVRMEEEFYSILRYAFLSLPGI